MPETTHIPAATPAPFHIPTDIDTSTAEELKPRLMTELQRHGSSLILDLEDVHFIDSTGLGMLVSVLREARKAGGTVRLINATREVMRLLQITGLERIFEIGASNS